MNVLAEAELAERALFPWAAFDAGEVGFLSRKNNFEISQSSFGAVSTAPPPLDAGLVDDRLLAGECVLSASLERPSLTRAMRSSIVFACDEPSMSNNRLTTSSQVFAFGKSARLRSSLPRSIFMNASFSCLTVQLSTV